MGFHDVPGHISYVLIALSYYLTDMFWLRVTAVVGLSMEIVYFRMSGGDLMTGMAWDAIFIAINLYQLYWLVDEYRRAQRIESVMELRSSAFASLPKTQANRLIQAGHWQTLSTGHEITREGEPVTALYYLADGHLEVRKGADTIAVLGPGAFVGEMAFVSGLPASATVACQGDVRVFSFDAAKLHKLVSTDETAAAALHQLIGRDLVQKLRSSQQKPATAPGDMPG